MDNSPLALLPPEVRNRIYAFTLAKPGQVRIKHPPPDWKKDPAIQPPLTRVCRQMRDECLLMFYALNDFAMEINVHEDWSQHNSKTFEQLKKLQAWVRQTRREYHQHVGKMHLELYMKYGEVIHAGSWHAGVSWRLNFRPWEDLMDTLRRYGYGRENISLCLFGEVKLLHRGWFSTLFSDVGNASGIEVDSRASQEGRDTPGELEVEGFLAGLPRSSYMIESSVGDL